MKNEDAVNRAQCRTCLYRPTETEKREGGFGCAYIILTGHRRPCDPSPNCTAYKPYTKAERMHLEDRLRWKREFELPVQRKRGRGNSSAEKKEKK